MATDDDYPDSGNPKLDNKTDWLGAVLIVVVSLVIYGIVLIIGAIYA